jgi:hypothetical protein
MQNVDGSSVDLISGGDQNPISAQDPDAYFDVSQFSFPTPFYLGNLGRNVLSSPGIATMDLTLAKDTRVAWLGEGRMIQFRSEFFNLFNRPNFGNPTTNLFDQNGNRRSGVGQITSTRTTSRQIQLALKLLF